MPWHERIVSQPGVLGGRPVIAGTRLSVDFLLELLAAGWSTDGLLRSYPQLTPDDLSALFAYALDVLRDESLRGLHEGAA